MSNIEELKNQILAANVAYRDGHPAMSDQDFDVLCEKLEKLVPKDEYSKFRDSLNESSSGYGAKIKHKYIMGSLDKIKSSEPASLLKFISSYVKDDVLNVSAKVDGISSVARYVDGKLVSFASRGNGYEGVSFFDKAKFIKGLPQQICITSEMYVRGELVILNDEEIEASTNRRNICAGWMNSKTWRKEDISKISFVPYAILGDKYTKCLQFAVLKKLGFNTAWNIDINAKQIDLNGTLEKYAHIEHKYSCDGLVLVGSNSHNELDAYRPKNAMAYKINELSAETRLIDIDWSSVSKDGYICPVAILEPVEIDGATISRATLHNLDMVESLGLMYGSKVLLRKANDIIPHIDKVIENDSHCSKIELPDECPCCGSKLVRDGINLRCKNKDCLDQVVYRLANFIKKLGVKSASNATLKNFGITSFKRLVEFTPDKKYKSEVKLYDELYAKVFSQSKEKLLGAMNFVGLSETSIDKIVSHYGYSLVESSLFKDQACKSLPSGIGSITLDKFIEDLPEALENIKMITNDTRWHWSPDQSGQSGVVQKTIGSICVTGNLKFGSRSKFLEFAKKHGYESKSSVSKGLTYLINNDINSNSSKNKKAKELGIKILPEDEFMKLVEKDSVETSLNDL